jgi:hypothetical protein
MNTYTVYVRVLTVKSLRGRRVRGRRYLVNVEVKGEALMEHFGGFSRTHSEMNTQAEAEAKAAAMVAEANSSNVVLGETKYTTYNAQS